MKKSLLALALSSLAFAGSVSQQVPVQINNTGGCAFQGLPATIDLGTIPPSGYATSTGQYATAPVSLNVACTSGINYTVSVASGYSLGSSYILLSKSGTYIRLALYKDSAYTQKLSSANTTIATGTGSGSSQTITVYPRIEGCNSTSCSPGVYTATITLRITY